MNDRQLTKLRLIESELLLIQRQLAELSARVYELHEQACDMLNAEFATPLTP